MGAQQDLYAVLSVPRTATADEIHQAFRQRARAVHPDVNPSPDATQQFQELNNAYQTLSDPSRRAAYDRISSGYMPSTGPGRPTDSSGYWSPPRTTYRPPYRTSTPYDEPFAPRPRRRATNGRSPGLSVPNALRYAWLLFLLLRFLPLSTTGLTSLWTTDNLVAFITTWLPVIAIGLIILVVTVGIIVTIRWWNR